MTDTKMSDEKGCREAFERFFASAIEQTNTAADAQNDAEKRLCWHVWDAAWSSRPAPQVEDLVKALEECRRLLADLTSRKPGESPPGSTIITFYARCVEAETKARAALAAYQQKDGKK